MKLADALLGGRWEFVERFYLHVANIRTRDPHMDIDSTPEFLADARDDLRACGAELAAFYAESDALARPTAPYVAPVPAGFVPMYVHQREALAADLGFLAVVAPDLFAWRVGGYSVAAHHATGRPTEVKDQAAARKARRHREYSDGVRIRPLAEVVR